MSPQRASVGRDVGDCRGGDGSAVKKDFLGNRGAQFCGRRDLQCDGGVLQGGGGFVHDGRRHISSHHGTIVCHVAAVRTEAGGASCLIADRIGLSGSTL